MKKNIIKDNKLIAEFMGDKFCTNFSVGMDFYDEGWLRKSNKSYYSKLQYHNSWDWLMPVIDKIESIAETPHTLRRVEINSHHVRHFPIAATKDIIAGCFLESPEKIKFATKLEAAYYVCVEFIKYYNNPKNKKKIQRHINTIKRLDT